jgi:hypothetical protein
LEEEERTRQKHLENWEQKRLKELREQEQADQQREHDRRKQLARPFREELDAVDAQIAPLQESLKQITFGVWYKKRFKWLVSYPDFLRQLVHEATTKSVPPKYKAEMIAEYAYLFITGIIQMVCWVVCLMAAGVIWIPMVYSADVKRLRDPIETQLSPLNARRQELSRKIEEVMKTGLEPIPE